jgi:aspartate kinase
MGPTIMKFGGTSVGDAPAFANVAGIIRERRSLRPVVVVSAMSGVTDALLASVWQGGDQDVKFAMLSLEHQFLRHDEVVSELLTTQAGPMTALVENVRREIGELLRSVATRPALRLPLQDAIVSFGERLAAALLAAVLREEGVAAREVDARRCILTDENYCCATPLIKETFQKTREQVQPLIEESIIPVLGGFIGSTLDGETTTLGRGGSDYTAALLGAALSAREIQIWTDVSGVLTADPRVEHRASTIPRLSYAEAAELAYFGAKVLHPKTIQPAVENGIPLRICNSRAPETLCTLVGAESETSPQTVKAIAHKTGITTLQITSARMLGAYGFLRALFEIFDRHRTAVDVVTTSEVSVSLSLDDAAALPSIVEELERLGSVRVEKDQAIICVVGEGLRSTPGIAARIFSTINDINVSLISQGASRINLTFAIEEERVAEAVTRLHEAFFGDLNLQRRISKVMTSGAETAG